MATKRPLRAVAADEKSVAPEKPKTLAEAIESGTYLEILMAQRREMVRDVRDEKGPAKAAMHRQIALLSKEISALQTADGDDEVGQAASTPDDDWDASAI